MLADALKLRQQELDGWLAMRTEKAPDGDMSGAGMAAMGIANISLLRGDVTNARKWYARCEELCPENDIELRAALRNNKKGLEKLGNMWLLHRKVLVHGLSQKGDYNGRRGCVVALFSTERWEVRLEASQELNAVHVIVHEKNLTLITSCNDDF